MSRAGGFTLVETLLALFLIGVGLLSVAPVFVYASRTAAAGGDMGEVGAVAVERLELIRSAPYASLVPGGSLTTSVAGYFDDSTPGLRVRWQVAINASPPGTRVITLRAEALRDIEGSRREVTLITMRGR